MIHPPADAMLAQHAARKPRPSKAERQAGLAARMAASLAAKAAGSPVAAAAPLSVVTPPDGQIGRPTAATTPEAPFQAPPLGPRPAPAAGQVWSSASPRNDGRRYIRLIAVRRRTTDAPYATAIEILADGTRRLDTILGREYMRTSLEPDGAMPPVYSFEPTVTETETLDLAGPGRVEPSSATNSAEEIPMSTNHAETVPAPSTKAALAAMAKTAEKKATPKTPKPARAKQARKAATPKAGGAAAAYRAPKVGEIVHKTYKGKELPEIKALAEGRFSYKGKTYETLSDLGKFIRGGKPTYGPTFFTSLLKK